MRGFLGLALLLAAGSASAQTAGTLNLQGPGTTPGAPAITAPALNAGVNAQLGTKQDYGTVYAANSMTIGSPAGGNMGEGSLNLVSLFVNGVAVGPIETYTPTNKGGTITSGGSSQVLMAANPNRVGCSFQPQTGDLWFNTVGTSAAAVQPSRYLPAPSEYTCPAGFRGAITIFGTVTGVSFAAEEDTVP